MELIKYIATFTQLLTFLISLFTYYKYRHTRLRLLPIFLGLTTLIELICLFYYRIGNVWLYNFLLIFEFNFYAYIFYFYVSSLNKKILIGLVVLFNLSVIIISTFGFQNMLKESFSYGYAFSNIFIIIILIMVFSKMLKIENMEGVTKNLLFWISFGLLIYYATSLPLFSISNWVDLLGDFSVHLAKLLFFAVELSNILFIIGFLWSKKKYIY